MLRRETAQLDITVRRAVVGVDVDDGAGGWTVDISEGGLPPILEGVRISHPLTAEQRETCRWYLEQYTSRSPFATDTASEAEGLLRAYPQTLLTSLRLQEALRLRHGPWRLGPSTVYINVCQDASAGPESIHQLLWEMLEEQHLWDSSTQVVVFRSIQEHHPARQQNPRDHDDRIVPWKSGTGPESESVNVLLVVARKLGRDQSQLEDVSPTLALEALLAAKRCQDGRRSRINLQVVRPATRQALEEHLQRARDRHGPGFFHLVHFDVHGKVGLRKGRLGKVAVLYLARPDSNSTMAIPATLLCRLVREHQIPFVVLNACESATSSGVDEANMAQQFLRQGGARNALGMSFRVANSSAAVFLKAFYRAFLGHHLSFAQAAAVGREVLRQNPERPSIHGLSREMRDSFVAVAYGLPTSFAIDSGATLVPEPIRYQAKQHATYEGISGARRGAPFFGRSFDLFRLDRLVAQSSLVYVSGMVGVGKTALLEQAAQTWKDTGFASIILRVCLSGREEGEGWCAVEAAAAAAADSKTEKEAEKGHQGSVSDEHIAKSVARQLLRQGARLNADLETGSTTALYEAITRAVSEQDTVVIVEGLEGRPLDQLAWSVMDLAPLSGLPLVKKLVSLARNQARTTRCRVIVTQRRQDPSHVERLLGHEFGPHCQDIQGLALPDAMELSISVLKSCCGISVEDWKHEDTEWLEAIILLVDSNPLALLTVLPLQRKLSIPWREFYGRLHGGLFASPSDLRAHCPHLSHALEDMEGVSQFSGPVYRLLCVLGMYWSESATLRTTVALFRRTSLWKMRGEGLGETVDCFDIGLPLVIDQGYVRLGRKKGTLQVSPILTIIGTACLRDMVTLATRVGIQGMFVRSMDDFAWPSSSSSSSSSSSTWSSTSHDGNEPSTTENLLTVLNLCTREVPVDAWPLAYLFSSFHDDIVHGTAPVPRALRTHVLTSLCHLLEILPRKLHLVDDDKPYVVIFSFGLHTLAAKSLANGSVELSRRVLDLAKTRADLAARMDQTAHAKEANTCRALIGFASMLCEWDLGPSDDYLERLLAFRTSLPSCEEEEYIAKFKGLAESLADGPGGYLPSRIKEEILAQLGDLHEPQQGHGWAEDTLRTLALSAAVLENTASAGQHSVLGEAAGVSWQESLAERLELTLPGERPLQQYSAQETYDVLYKMTMISLGARDDGYSGSAASQRHGAHDESERRLLELMYNERQWPELCNVHLDAAQDLFRDNEFRTGIGRLEELLQILHKAAAEPSLLSAATACCARAYAASLNDAYLISSTPSGGRRRRPSSPPGAAIIGGDPDACSAWWDRIHLLVGQDPSWTRQVFKRPDAHPLPLAIMTEMHRLHHLGDAEQVLYQLAALERVSGRTLFPEQPGAYPLQAVRDLFELAAHQQHAINDVLGTAAADPAAAEASLDALEACCMPSFCRPVDRATIRSLRLVVEQHWLTHFQLGKYRCETPAQMRALYRKFRHLLDTGRLQHSSKGALSRVSCSFLACLSRHAAENQMWEEGLLWLDELFATVDLPSLRLDAEMLAGLEDARRALRACRLSELLDSAEASLDFVQCVTLAERAEGLSSDASVGVDIMYPTSWTGGTRVMTFLKEAYRARCLPCARWIRRSHVQDLYTGRGRAGRIFRRVVAVLLSRDWEHYRSAGLARWRMHGRSRTSMFRRRRQLRWRTPKPYAVCQHVGRYAFAAPFGCRHRCEGGYCFYDRDSQP